MRALIAMLMLVLAPLAQAHRAGDALLDLRVDGGIVRGEILIALRDLEPLLGLDADGDDRVTWGELQAAQPRLQARLGQDLALATPSAACALGWHGLALRERDDGPAVRLRVHGQCLEPVRRLTLRYGLMFALDRQHRGLVALAGPEGVQTAVLSPDSPVRDFDIARPDAGDTFRTYVVEGAHHIAIGADHILFLVALLLTAAFRPAGRGWVAESRFAAALGRACGIVTAFTLAHSLTLGLAVFGLLALPSRLVESLIAASVLAAALNNLWPLVRRLWLMTFAFGLVHGLGFANVLAELGLPPSAKGLALLAFNLGVELGQLALVAGLLPVLFALRRRRLYRPALLAGGSCAIALLAAIWLAERVGERELLAWL